MEESTARKKPGVFLISQDKEYLAKVLGECEEAPSDYTILRSIKHLIDDFADEKKIGLTFVFIIEQNGRDVDTPALRDLKLNYPQIHFIVMLEKCEQSDLLRFQSMGVQNILLPPFEHVSLSREIATAIPNVPQFKRHPELFKRGQIRMDFLMPSDLSYVLGVNYLVSMLLKEFDYPVVDSRVNIPLACDEAVTNAILHGNNNDSSKKVRVQVYLSHSRFKIRIRDEGEGFNIVKLEDPTEGDNLLRSSGRGIFLMRSIMDSVEFKEGGRVVELEKKNCNTRKN